MKNLYMAAYSGTGSWQEHNEKFFAHVIKIGHSENVLSILGRYRNLKAANFCETKKQAEEIVNAWNECFRNNGTLDYLVVR